MAKDPVTAISTAIGEGFKLIAKILSGAEKRRMRKAIEYGERYIRRANRKHRLNSKDKTLDKYTKAFFKYNN